MPVVRYVAYERAKLMTDAVNRAKTETEHCAALQRLSGYQQRCEEMGQAWPSVELDLSDETDRPLCCGIWLDWKPDDDSKAARAAQEVGE